MVNVHMCIEDIRAGKLLSVQSIVAVCQLVKDMLVKEPNIISVAAPVSICGDLHGQFCDLLELFRSMDTDSSKHKFVFLGDYVDRGNKSIETMAYLCCLKLLHVNNVVLIRGNHESRQVTQVYGFHAECMKKYAADGMTVWKAFTDMFDFLPIGALIENQLLCIHGGLSPLVHCMDQLRVLNRFGDIPSDGPLADIVWSDPDTKNSGFHMSPRGAGFLFGEDIVQQFLHLNDIQHITRAHQLCMEGYQLLFHDTFSTVWSAPNYCFRFGNKASVLTVGEKLERSFHVFKAADQENDPGREVASSSSTDVIDLGYFM